MSDCHLNLIWHHAAQTAHIEFVCGFVCVCVCVHARARERGRDSEYMIDFSTRTGMKQMGERESKSTKAKRGKQKRYI